MPCGYALISKQQMVEWITKETHGQMIEMETSSKGFKIMVSCIKCGSNNCSLTINQWYDMKAECSKCGNVETVR